MSECQDGGNVEHHHRGKSSEGRLDKRVILKELEMRVGETVFDAGCGDGYMAKEFSKLVTGAGKVYALDPDDISIGGLKKETAGSNVEAMVGDITTKSELRDCSMDWVYLSTVIHGFSAGQMEGFKAEVRRLLKKSGRLAIVEIRKEDTPFGPPMELRLSPEELGQEMGLIVEKLVDVGEFFYLVIFRNETV